MTVPLTVDLHSRTNPFEEWRNDTCMRRVKLNILDKILNLFEARNKVLGPTAFINAQRKNNTTIPPEIHARKSDPGGRDAKNLLDFGLPKKSTS
ncbi:hypothetical protein GQ457_11G027300 [Hibiscus cannabinus]